MVKIDTLFMAEKAKTTIPFVAAYTYIAHMRENSLPGFIRTAVR